MSQNAIAYFPALPVAPPLRAGIRVVVIEKDPSVRERLAAAFAKASAFVMAASADTLFRGMQYVDEYVPEVVLCGADHLAHSSLQQYDGLLLETTSRNGEILLRDSAGDSFSLSAGQITRALAEIETEVLSRKREWLRYLLSSASSMERQGSGEHADRNPSPKPWPTEEVVWVRAQRNYVVLHSSTGTWKQRGSLSTIQSRLPAGNFLRISRSCAVNRARIQSVLRKENHLAITMICGTVLRPSRSYMRAVLQAVPEFVEPAVGIARVSASPPA
jgi:hypothetical protein